MEFVELYTFDYSEDKKPRTLHLQSDPLTRTLQDVSFADRGGGFGYPVTTPIGNHGFIIWRSHAEVLELSEFLCTEMMRSSLRISFSTSAIVDCTVAEFSGYIECLVCTSNGPARFTFKNGHTSRGFCGPSSVFDEDPVFYAFYQLKGLQPSLIKVATSRLCASTGDALFAYGLSSGVILFARVPFKSTVPSEVFELHQSSVMQKLWSGITPFVRPEIDSLTSAVDIALTDSPQLLLSVCKDHRLRLWDIKHRGCIASVDLAELVSGCGSNRPSSSAVQHSQFSPGMFHRVNVYSPTRSDDQVCGALVYVSLSPSTQTAESCLPGRSFNYWCWFQVDNLKALHHDRDCIRVLSVQPVDHPDDPEHNVASSGPTSDVSVIEFMPATVNTHTTWWIDGDTERQDNHKFLSQGNTDAHFIEPQGVWWLTHQVADEPNTLDYRYSLGWSTASGVKQPRDFAIAKQCRVLSAGSAFNCLSPQWKRLPACLEVDLSINVAHPVIYSGILDALLNHMFEPNNLSWFAIDSALKSLRSSHQLLQTANIPPTQNMHELRSQVYHTLADQYFTDLPPVDFLTVLRTFYMTAVDYHDHGLQPLGLFEVPSGTGLLLPVGSKTYIPYSPGLIVVRRWGFSVIRPLDKYERLLWRNTRQLDIAPTLQLGQSGNLMNADVDVTVLHVLRQCRLLLDKLQLNALWSEWESSLFGKDILVVEPKKLAIRILEELDDHCCALESLSFTGHASWRRTVVPELLEDSNYLLALEKLTAMLEGSLHTLKIDEDLSTLSDSNNSHLDLQESNSALLRDISDPPSTHTAVPSLATTFLCESFFQTCDTRLKLAFSLLLLCMRYHFTPATAESIVMGENDVASMDVVSRLAQVVHSLRVLRWIACTRMQPNPKLKSSSVALEHLSLLGLSNCFDSVDQDGPTTTPFSSTCTAGVTLLSQLCCRWPGLLVRTAAPDKAYSQDTPWTLRCFTLSKTLYKILDPNSQFGVGMLPVFRHLLLGGHSTNLLKLAKFLCPTPLTINFSPATPGMEEDDLTHVEEATSWHGDCSLLFLSVGLAHLWLGCPELAEEEFVRASEWLYCFAQSLSSANTDSFFPVRAKVTRPNVNNLLLPALFPGEFAAQSLFCLANRVIDSHGLCPEEVQVRFLMKVMPVLEATDSVVQLLNLSEFALNVLAKVHLSSPSSSQDPADLNSEPHLWAANSRRLTSVLANLHSFPDQSSEGFLCDPVLSGEESPSLLYTHLTELEAALWTRMFKHHLQLGNYALAHLLIRSNPDTARRRDCLRQLIVTLCDRREAAQLVSFHYGPSEEEFLLILEARARATDVLPLSQAEHPDEVANPYYDVLYAFHIRRANYRAAAMVLFEHAHRLAEEAFCSIPSLYGNGFRAGCARLLFGLQRQAACLVAAINALYLVPEEHRWLVRPGVCTTVNTGQSKMEKNMLTEPNSRLELLVSTDWAFETTCDLMEYEGNAELDLVDQRSVNGIDSVVGTPVLRTAQTKQVLQMPDLLRLYALARARLRIAQVCWEQGMLHAVTTSPSETVQSLLSLAMYDEAVKFTEQFNLVRSQIVDTVAARCAEFAQQMPAARTSTGSDFVAGSNSSCQVSPLPGLASLGSPFVHEKNLVIQSLHNLNDNTTRSQNPLRGDAGTPLTGVVLSGSRDLPLADLYWLLLETILTRLDPPQILPRSRLSVRSDPGQLHLSACQHILRSGPVQIHPPEWLVLRLRSASAHTSRPASLLRLYLQYDRVEAAYKLAMDMLDAAQGVLADPKAFGLRATLESRKPIERIGGLDELSAQSLWLPHGLFVRLLEALRLLSSELPACSTMHENMSKNMTSYLTSLKLACSRLNA